MTESEVITDWRKSLLDHRGIFKLYVENFWRVGGDYDHAALAIVIILALCGTLFSQTGLHSEEWVAMSSKTISGISPVICGIAVGILGFLITAFALFVSMLSKTLVIQLSKIPHSSDKNLSQFGFILISNIVVLLDYSLVTFFSGIIAITSNDGGLIQLQSSEITQRFIIASMTANTIAVVALATLTFRAILQLRLFLKNLYQGLTLYAATLPES